MNAVASETRKRHGVDGESAIRRRWERWWATASSELGGHVAEFGDEREE